jgi:hypothetical protein
MLQKCSSCPCSHTHYLAERKTQFVSIQFSLCKDCAEKGGNMQLRNEQLFTASHSQSRYSTIYLIIKLSHGMEPVNDKPINCFLQMF